ncbi:MAG: SpoIID/LytB domain-containing protein [Acidobacteriota bacterium]
MPLPTGMPYAAVSALAAGLAWLAAIAAAASAPAGQPGRGPVPPGAAYFERGLADPTDRREAGSAVLDTPVLPGSLVKAVTLAVALESHVIEPETAQMCRRRVTVDGQTYVCAHPDLRRPLTAAEALAHSCNDYFVSLAPRLSRAMVNQTRVAAGLPPLAAGDPLAPAIVGLAGPRVTPRTMLDVLARLAGVDAQRTVPLAPAARRALLDGLRGAASYGTASALGAAGIPALAKTGTSPMQGGGALGLVVALVPADRPTRGIVVVVPGAGGLDAAAIAADVLRAAAPATLPARPEAVVGRAGARAPVQAGALPATIRLGVTTSTGVRIDTVPLDDYIARVVAGEGQPRAAPAAQEALAIVARTFAVANRNRHRREGYDLCDTTHCQVTRPPTEAARRAATATSGRILLHSGQPAFVFYSAWCGGRPEQASRVWPGAEDYGSDVGADEACSGEPPWSAEVRAADLERVLRAAGLRGGRLRALRVVGRNASGRVARLRAEGFAPTDLDGHEFRMAVGRVLGWQVLKSTAFDLHRTGTGYRFEGRGFGHGVGLCVVGAGHRAAGGASAEAILRFYYPGLSLGAAAVATASEAPAPSSRDAQPEVTDIRLTLPATEQSERDAVLREIRRARDDIRARAGVTAPATIDVVVHPTTESFRRATGEPWWAAGAASGTRVDLLPVSVLRRQRLLERTIRHELAHVLVDGLLAGRPMWVREGAAMYFAEPERRPPSTTRPDCPTDDELLHPLSAGAEREAYGRADACFRLEIARGRRWTDIR